MSSVVVIARKEIRDALRSKRILLLISFLAIAILISVWVASVAFGLKMSEYNTYLAALSPEQKAKALLRPQLFPLTLLRSGIEYLEIIGALFAFVIGFASVSKERSHGTSLLLMSRPVSKREIIFGKIGGLAVVWAGALVFVYLTSVAAITIIGHGSLQFVDLIRLAVAFIGAGFYLLCWSMLAVAITSRITMYASAILVGITSWLTIVLVLPQIGDTMDPDNQIPGGLFGTLGIIKSNEVSILSHFHTFDVIRNAIEVSSITKLFERVAFAFLGIKDKYNQLPLGTVARALGTSIAGILAFTLSIGALTYFISSNEKTLRRRSS